VKLAHALNGLFEAVRPPQRLTRKLAAPNHARPDEEFAQRLDRTAVDCRRRERLFALGRMPTPPCDQTRNLGVCDLI
jgi:hypothetical protein